MCQRLRAKWRREEYPIAVSNAIQWNLGQRNAKSPKFREPEDFMTDRPARESTQAEILKIDPLYRIRKYDALTERMKNKQNG